MGADNIALLGARNRPDHWAAFTCRRRSPMNREFNLRTRRRMRRNPNMISSIRTSHHPPRDVDGRPGGQARLPAIEGFFSMAELRLNTTAVSNGRGALTVGFTTRS